MRHKPLQKKRVERRSVVVYRHRAPTLPLRGNFMKLRGAVPSERNPQDLRTALPDFAGLRCNHLSLSTEVSTPC